MRPPTQQVLILRHGESEWNVEGRWQGWIDIGLTAAGEEQAARRARQLARDSFRPRAIYASDLRRAAHTAEIIAGHLDVPAITDTGFRERHGGEWQGHTSDEIDVNWPGQREKWRHGELSAPPGGEDDDTVLARFDSALMHALAHVGTGLLGIVTHHGILRLVATRAGVDVHTIIPNLGGFWFDVRDGALCDPVALDTLRDDDERPALE
ncbi:MAG TPA: histidine phosphatase family protein [Acidimicrobiia bacterium]|jgi:broad specificity phosphatase PhoE|nr:histidine phosphatase family protein [Acidimicrobiia bacterium]